MLWILILVAILVVVAVVNSSLRTTADGANRLADLLNRFAKRLDRRIEAQRRGKK